MFLKVQAPGAFIIKLTDLKCTKNVGIMWKASVLVTVSQFHSVDKHTSLPKTFTI
jgi:hypothetical protein